MPGNSFETDSENIARKIYKLFTLSPKRLDLQEMKSHYPDGKFEITDPWSPNNMGSDRINAICHHGLATPPQVPASERSKDTALSYTDDCLDDFPTATLLRHCGYMK